MQGNWQKIGPVAELHRSLYLQKEFTTESFPKSVFPYLFYYMFIGD